MFEGFGGALGQIFQLATILTMLVGVVAGLIASAIPGFTITMAIVLTLPLTFHMPAIQGVATMLAVYVGGLCGGMISAALLSIPGTPSAVATTFDAFPMARNGDPGRALGLGIWASFFGTIISVIVLVLAAPPLALIAIELGPWEYFALIVFAMTVIASLVGESILRGMIAGILGMFLATIGDDPIMGAQRFSFDLQMLQAGLPFLAVLIGIFAVSQLLSELEDIGRVQRGKALVDSPIVFRPFQFMRETLSRPVNLIRSSLIGVFIGAVPGAGGSIANLLAYDQARQASKTPEKFGTGISEGVVASESGNSSTAGGGLIPMIALGIPGSAVDAVLIAALMVHGISVGPRLMVDNPELVQSIFVAMVVAAVMMLVIALMTMRYFLMVTKVPKHVIVPLVLVFCAVGVFALNNRVTDVHLLFFVGALGYLLKKMEYPLAPLVLGVILGPIAETNLRRALMADEDWTLFFTRPVSAGFFVLAVISILLFVRYRYRQRKKAQEADTG
ncbi:tripartite tricarboxylate transporter permease [Fodinicurvata halophila]|uniref:Tripartite tricarboxylate transporter permease n=1 Tax=Fodinicurvata halophila TaxID=1419723 RepID=A0ABV8UGM2_9PROT